MPNCKKCGKPVTVAPIICSECQAAMSPEAVESIMEKLCDDYCRWPLVHMNEEEMAAKCDKCEIDAMIRAMVSGKV